MELSSDIWSLVYPHLGRHGGDWINLACVSRSTHRGFIKFQNGRLGRFQCLLCTRSLKRHSHRWATSDGKLQVERTCADTDPSTCIPLHLPADQQVGWCICTACQCFYYQCPQCDAFCNLVEHPGKPLFHMDFFRLTESNDYDEDVGINFNRVDLREFQSSPSSSVPGQPPVYYFLSDFRWPLSVVRLKEGSPLVNTDGGYYVGDRTDRFLDTCQWFPFNLVRDHYHLNAVVDTRQTRSKLVWKCPKEGRIFTFQPHQSTDDD